MSAKKLGRFTAGLVVAVGLAVGGLLLGGNTAVTAAPAPSTVVMTQAEYDWT